MDSLYYDAVNEELQLDQGDWIADIGSGSGSYLNKFARAVGEQGHIFAVDIDADSFDDLHDNMDSWDYYNITPVYSIQQNPLLPPSSFDGIMMRLAYHEFTAPLEMLRHFKNSLKPNGRLVIFDSMDEELVHLDREEQEDDHRLDIELAKADLEQAGFEIISKDPALFRHPQRDSLTMWMLVAQPGDQ